MNAYAVIQMFTRVTQFTQVSAIDKVSNHSSGLDLTGDDNNDNVINVLLLVHLVSLHFSKPLTMRVHCFGSFWVALGGKSPGLTEPNEISFLPWIS